MKSTSLHIDVAFYDEKHRELFSKYPSFEQIQLCVNDGIDVPIEEFYTYYLFHRKPASLNGVGPTYDDLARQTYKAKTWLEDQLDLTAGRIAVAAQSDLPKEITERAGEAVGLSVVNRIFGLTEADWLRIPTGVFKTFDYGYSVGSDGNSIIQLETKGNSTSNPTLKNSVVSEHKGNIEKKKAAISVSQAQGRYPHPASVRIGTITAISKTRDHVTRCWLLDPESERDEFAPRKIRIISRLSFLHAWLSVISPHSAVSIALANRLGDVQRSSDPDEFSGAPLLDGTGKAIELRTVFSRGMPRMAFFATKSVVRDGPAGGVVAQAEKNRFVFFGVMEELVNLAVEQDFDRILAYRRASGIVNKRVACMFSNTRFRRLDLPQEAEQRVKHSRHYASLEMSGELYYTQSGFVFGVLGL